MRHEYAGDTIIIISEFSEVIEHSIEIPLVHVNKLWQQVQNNTAKAHVDSSANYTLEIHVRIYINYSYRDTGIIIDATG